MTKASELLALLQTNESKHSVGDMEKPISKEEHHAIVKSEIHPDHQETWKSGTAKKFVNKHGTEVVAIHHPSKGTHLFQKSSSGNGHFMASSRPYNTSNHADAVHAHYSDSSMDKSKQFH